MDQHKSNFLSGPEPEEVEQKTAAQLNDTRRPSTMQVSSSMFDLAETDDRPAIEQAAAKGTLFNQNSASEQAAAKSAGGGKNFHIDADFAAAMKERDRKERTEREKKRRQAEKEEEKATKERQQKIQEELQNSQSLDETEVREKIKDEIAEENLKKLYPDRESFTEDVEDTLWKSRAENGAQIASRAKIEDVVDTRLSSTIGVSIVVQLIAAVLVIVGLLLDPNDKLSTFFCAIGAIAIIITAVMLIINGNKTPKHQVPSDQRRQFTLATTIPGFLLRLVFIAIFSHVPLTGNLICGVVGAAIGGSIHYTILNRYNIRVSIKDTLINTAIYIAYSIIALIPAMGNDNQAAWQLIYFALGTAEFFLGDQAAMKLALYSDK